MGQMNGQQIQGFVVIVNGKKIVGRLRKKESSKK